MNESTFKLLSLVKDYIEYNGQVTARRETAVLNSASDHLLDSLIHSVESTLKMLTRERDSRKAAKVAAEDEEYKAYVDETRASEMAVRNSQFSSIL